MKQRSLIKNQLKESGKKKTKIELLRMKQRSLIKNLPKESGEKKTKVELLRMKQRSLIKNQPKESEEKKTEKVDIFKEEIENEDGFHQNELIKLELCDVDIDIGMETQMGEQPQLDMFDALFYVYRNGKFQNRPVMMKTIDGVFSNKKKFSSFESLLKKLFNFSHPNVVRAIGYSVPTKMGTVCVVTENTESSIGYQLEQIRKSRAPSDEEYKFRILGEFLKGLNYLHSKDFAHKELHPKLIMLKKNRKVKIDFGFGLQKVNIYSAPELIREEKIKKEKSLDVCYF